MPQEHPVAVNVIRACQSVIPVEDWAAYLSGHKSLTLPSNSSHTLEVQAEVHSTAFLHWSLQASQKSQIRLKVTYSEGYELDPNSYPFFRTKADRLNSKDSFLVGPFDEVTLDLPAGQVVKYEPFWFRTFRIIRLEIQAISGAVELLTFEAKQVNYPLAVKACWKAPQDGFYERTWDVSIRTMRNCMFDGYSDCPFYEQLQ